MRGADPGPFLVPVHGVARIAVKDDVVDVALLDYDWFIRAIGRKALGRLSTAVDDRRNAVFTATDGRIVTVVAARRRPAPSPRRQRSRGSSHPYEMVAGSCHRTRRLARARSSRRSRPLQDEYASYELLAPETNAFRTDYEVAADDRQCDDVLRSDSAAACNPCRRP
jgi:hypothetical protein